MINYIHNYIERSSLKKIKVSFSFFCNIYLSHYNIIIFIPHPTIAYTKLHCNPNFNDNIVLIFITKEQPEKGNHSLNLRFDKKILKPLEIVEI